MARNFGEVLEALGRLLAPAEIPTDAIKNVAVVPAVNSKYMAELTFNNVGDFDAFLSRTVGCRPHDGLMVTVFFDA